MTQENSGKEQALAFAAALSKAASILNVHPAFMQGAIEKIEHLANALRIGLASGVVRPMWKPTMTVVVGGYAKDRLCERMQETGFKDRRVFEMIRRPEFRVTSVARKARLIVISPRDIGFSDDGPMEPFLERAGKFGLQICPDDVAHALWLGDELSIERGTDLRNLTRDSYVRVAMDPTPEERGYKEILAFNIMNNDLKNLGPLGYDGRAFVDAGHIFVLP